MIQEQTFSWIFLAIALATNSKATNFEGIALVADGINHAVPTHKELQLSISWLTKKELIMKQGKNYELTIKGKLEYEKASQNTHILFSIWKNIEINFINYVDQ